MLLSTTERRNLSPHRSLKLQAKTSLRRYRRDKIIIDTGSTPFIPAISGLKENAAYTQRGNAWFGRAAQAPDSPSAAAISVWNLPLSTKDSAQKSPYSGPCRIHAQWRRGRSEMHKRRHWCIGRQKLNLAYKSIPSWIPIQAQSYVTKPQAKNALSAETPSLSPQAKAITAELNLAAAGIETNSRGGMAVTDTFRTTAAGDLGNRRRCRRCAVHLCLNGWRPHCKIRHLRRH